MKLRHLLVLSSFLAMFSFARAEPLKVGDAAPAVIGTTETGAKLAFADVYAKQTYTLVYFYPKADTAGCTKQGCSLRHDDVAAQKAFKTKYVLPFTLIADPEGRIIGAFGVPTYPVVGYAHRQAYLIKGGKIIYADYAGTTDKQAEAILKVLAAQ